MELSSSASSIDSMDRASNEPALFGQRNDNEPYDSRRYYNKNLKQHSKTQTHPRLSLTKLISPLKNIDWQQVSKHLLEAIAIIVSGFIIGLLLHYIMSIFIAHLIVWEVAGGVSGLGLYPYMIWCSLFRE